MQLDNLLITGFGVFGIIFTYWFFLMRKQKVIQAKDSVDITVDGGYSPEVISIPIGKTTKLNFTRRDPNSCLEEVNLPDFKIKKNLPLRKTVTIEITPKKKGDFIYSCGMNMYHGKIVVE